jgi:hypothetical protein
MQPNPLQEKWSGGGSGGGCCRRCCCRHQMMMVIRITGKTVNSMLSNVFMTLLKFKF